MHHPGLLTAAAALLAGLPSAQAGIYTKSSPVIQLDARNFDSLISQSNYTSIVEFYAPWCGHCQNLKPAYEKAAKNLEGLAKVAAIDCDDDANKPLCGAHGVQGFPTLKTFRPGKKPGKPIVEDYQGPRTALGITEEVNKKINNHVSKLTDKDLEGFLAKSGPKAILFSEKGATSALLRSIAIDFLDVINVAQIRNKEEAAVKRFGIEKYPTLVLIPDGADAEPVIYSGDLKKKDMVEFLKAAGEPNPDPAPKGQGKKSKGDKKKQPPVAEPEPEEDPESSTTKPTEPAAPSLIPIEPITSSEVLLDRCLHPESHTCVLAFVPGEPTEEAVKALDSLTTLNTKYIHGGRKMFPFYAVLSDLEAAASVREALELSKDVELVAVNARRGWWRHYAGDLGVESVEAWIDDIRMGEGSKEKLSKDLLSEKAPEESPEASSSETQSTDQEAKPEASEEVHDEL